MSNNNSDDNRAINIEETKINTENVKAETVVANSKNEISGLKAYYEGIIEKILAEKNDIENNYKQSLIKEHLQNMGLNSEILYLVMKGRGDIDKIIFDNGTIKGFNELIESYKLDKSMSALFTEQRSSLNKIDTNHRAFKTKPLTSIGGNTLEKEKKRICDDWSVNFF